MLHAHPYSIRFSPNGHDGDDHSELTGPSNTDHHWQDNDLLGNRAADPYYYHNFGGILPSSPEKREIVELKIQLARQQEKLESLSLKLRQCEDENEILEAQKAVLVNELAIAIKKQTATKREEQLTIESKFKDNAGPIRQLVDFNAALTAENDRMQVIIDVTRKSFKTHIRESRKRQEEDRKTFEALRLRGEDKVLQLHRELSKRKDLRRSSSERTAKTSLRSSFTESVKDDSLGSVPVPEVNFGTSGDGWIAEGEEAENACVRKRAPRARRKTVDCASSEDAKWALGTGLKAPGPTTARGWSNIIWC